MTSNQVTRRDLSTDIRGPISFWQRNWERMTFWSIILLGAGLRLWRIDQNGYGTEYYSAAVRSMMSSPHNFLYNSFDPAGFVSLDKPPVAFWVQVVSAKLLGFQGFSLLLPQVLEGLAALGLVYHLVRRRFGSPAGLLAAFFLALSPVSVAIDRTNNTDSCLILILLLAAWMLMRAAEEGRRSFLLLSLALIGIGFNVKMLAAFVVLPTFVLVYFLGAPLGLKRRIMDLTIGGFVLVVVSLSWAFFYDLTPPDQRPFAGSTRGNSMLELSVVHNGLGRFIRLHQPVQSPQMDTTTAQTVTSGNQSSADSRSLTGFRSRDRWSRIFVRVPAGPLRLADRQLAGQVTWLFPLALIGLAVALFQFRFRSPPQSAHLTLILWAGWALTYGIVLSFAGGIIHFYYLAALGPPLGALAGIGLVRLWAWYLERGWRAFCLPATLVLTALWQAYIESAYLGWNLDTSRGIWTALIQAAGDQSGDWRTWLFFILLGGTLVAVTGLLVPLIRRALIRATPYATAMLGLGLLALLVTPAAWALSSVLAKEVTMLPSADLTRLVTKDVTISSRRPEGPRQSWKLVAFLKANRRGERYLLATLSSRLAAPIIVRTGEPVMPMGGYMGMDPILTPEKLARMAKLQQVRFVMLGDLLFVDRRMGAAEAVQPLADWVRENGRPVDPGFWRSINTESRGSDLNAPALSRNPNSPRQPVGRGLYGRGSHLQLYDLRPEAGLIPAPSG